MRVVFLGTPEIAVPALKALIDAEDMEVSLVISQPDRKRSRGKFTPTPVKALALAHGIPVITPESVNAPEIIEQIRQAAPDVLLVIAFGQLIGDALLSAYPNHILNMHASLLPRYRGAAPMQRALMDGQEETGISAMLIEKGLDSGDVLGVERVQVTEETTLASLTAEMAEKAAQLTLRILRDYENALSARIPQDPAEVTIARKITKDDARLDFNAPAAELVHRVQALSDWPGTKFILDQDILKVHRAHVVKGSTSFKPGTVVSATPEGIAIQTGDGIFVIDVLQAPNRKAVSARDFLNGHPVSKGTIVGQWHDGKE